MATTANAGDVSTLSDFIREYDSEPIRVDKFYLKQVLFDSGMDKKLVINENSLLDKYIEELKTNKQKLSLNTAEYYKYRYNPKKLSYDLYGTTELWFLILSANELFNASDFDLRQLYLYDSAVLDKLNRIIDLEKDFSEINDSEVNEALIS